MEPKPPLSPDDPRFIAVHRLVGETMAGRPIALLAEGRRWLATPMDGGQAMTGALALAAPRVRYLGLGDAAALVSTEGGGPERFAALASAHAPDLAGVTAAPSVVAEAATEVAKLAERLPAMMVADGAPADVLAADISDALAFRASLSATVAPVAASPVPLRAGATATVTAFRNAIGTTASAVAVGEPQLGALVRVHSSCITGDVFGSLKCDCGAQLDAALERVAAEGGVLIYTAQEGRGIGLVNKLRAYALQDDGLDTVDANLALGYHDDERDYGAAAAILWQLGYRDVRLLTNNPQKVEALAATGLRVVPERLITTPTEENRRYLNTKRRRSGHRL